MKRVPLSRSFTVRVPGPLLRRLGVKARERGETPSTLVRRAIEELAAPDSPEKTLGERTAHILGSLDNGELPAGREARKALRNWDPDRRGESDPA